MSKVFTTDALIKTSLRRAMLPSSQSTFTDEDIIDIMNEELAIHVLPMVLRFHEEYYVIDEDVEMSANTIRYKIPYRATGNKLRDVQYVDSAGTQYEMTRVSLEDRPEYQGNYTNNQFLTFYLESDDVVLMQNQILTGNIRMSYYLRPNNLVEDDRAGVITNIAVGATQTVFTLSSFPEFFSSTTVYDFIQGKSPNKIKAFDRTVASTDSTASTVTFDNDDLLTIDLFSITPKAITFEEGDLLMKAEETKIPQLPTELHPILAQRTAVKMLEALGDSEGMANAQKELERMEFNAGSLIDNRVEGAGRKISNRHSILKSSLSNKLYRRRGL